MRKLAITMAAALGALAAFCAWGEWVHEGEWGKYGSGDGEFNFPWGIAVAPGGNVYVTEHFGRRVQRFTATGSFLGKWTTPWDGSRVRGIGVAPNGNVYVSSGDAQYEAYVGYFTSAGSLLGTWQVQGVVPGAAFGVRVAPGGTVYVAEARDERVSRYTSSGSMLGSFGVKADGLALAPNGNVYATGWWAQNRVYYFTPTGSLLGSWGSTGSGDGQFDEAHGLDVAPDGYVYVADRYNCRIQYFTANGSFLGKWGTNGQGKGEFYAPWDVAVSADGKRIYVVESGNHRVQYFRWSGDAVEPGSLGRVKALFR
jgi:tripartite motif-containing protein 71